MNRLHNGCDNRLFSVEYSCNERNVLLIPGIDSTTTLCTKLLTGLPFSGNLLRILPFID